MAKIKLSAEQKSIVEADPRLKLLVDAGPGTGKTEVACARAAWLIQNSYAKPHQILFVSFTRAAVKESQDRISAYLGSAGSGAQVKMSTLDSLAGQLLSGFGSLKKNFSSYDDNIVSLVELIGENQELRDYLAGFRHIFVDEGQDTYSPRSELVQELIWLITEKGGATIFFDFAQSIYGWADEEDESDEEKLNLPTVLQLFSSGEFETKSLTQIHRSKNKTIQRLFTDGRAILASAEDGQSQLNRIQALVEGISNTAEPAGKELQEAIASADKDSFYLFERRAEALAAASYLTLEQYRIRLTGQSAQIFPWVGVAFWDWVEDSMTKSEFAKLYEERRLGSFAALGHEESWALLFSVAEHDTQRNSVDMDLLAKRLSSSPPLDLVSPTIGSSGPVFSTIHGAKGLQAKEVNLFLNSGPQKSEFEPDLARRARVIYVGASRAREILNLGETSGFGGKLSSGRAKMEHWNNKVRIEVGRDGDLLASGLVGRDSFIGESDARAAQERILELNDTRSELTSIPRSDQNLIHDLMLDGSEKKIGSLSNSLGWDIRNATGRRSYSAGLWYLRSLGIHTIAVAPNEAERSELHYPWNQSGFVLSPALTGFSMLWKSKYKK